MASVLDPSDVVDEYGEYYLGDNTEANQNAARILKLPTQTSETSEMFPLNLTTAQGLERRSQVTQDRILQPFQKDFTPIGTTAFLPRSVPMFRLKIDLEATPDDLVQTWLGFLTSNNLNRAEWPFIRWWIEAVIIPQHMRDLEMNESYLGEFAAPVALTPGAASTAMDGVKFTINTFIDNGDTVALTMGAVPTDPEDFCTYVEQMAKLIPELYWMEGLTFSMSKVLAMRYRQGRKLKYNMNYAQVSDLSLIEEFDNFKIKGLFSHNGSTKIWTTPEWNKTRLVNGIGNIKQFKVENVDRKVKIYTDYWMGLGFWVPEVIFTNDVELL